MTGYLALDRLAVATLGTALDRALAELANLVPDDRAASFAEDAVARARRLLIGWDDRIRHVARCAALVDALSFAVPGVGLPVVLPDVSPVAPADILLGAIVLADRLRPLADERSPQVALDALGEAIEGAPAALVTATLLALGVAWFSSVMARLAAGARASGRGDDPGAIEDVDAAMATVRSLGRGLAAPLGNDPAWERAWAAVDLPLAAELLAGAATRMAPVPLGRMAGEALTRAAGADPSPTWRHAGITVLGAVATDPGAARLALLALDDNALDHSLFELDPVASSRFLRAATDPTLHGPDDAMAPVGRFVEAVGRLATSGRYVVFTDAPDARPGPPLDWWLHPEGHGYGPDPALPMRSGELLGLWLPRLLTPVPIAGWTPGGTGAPWPSADTDAVSHAVTLLMTNPADATAIRTDARAFFTASLIGSPADQQHGAYLLGAVEDASRSAGQRRSGLADGLDALSTSVGVLTSPLSIGASVPAGVLMAGLVGQLGPDARDLAAEAEAAGFDTAAAVGFAALGVWQTRHASAVPPLPPAGAADDDVDPEDRADAGAGRAARQVRAWAATIPDPALAAEAIAVYDRVESAASQGAGFTA